MPKPKYNTVDGLPLESAIQAHIKEVLTLSGWQVWEMYKGSTQGGSVWATKGLPDLYVFKAGRAVWLEVKRPKVGRLSPAQHERHRELTLCGLPVHVVTGPSEALAVLAG